MDGLVKLGYITNHPMDGLAKLGYITNHPMDGLVKLGYITNHPMDGLVKLGCITNHPMDGLAKLALIAKRPLLSGKCPQLDEPPQLKDASYAPAFMTKFGVLKRNTDQSKRFLLV